jgi:hypothetical protein
MAEKDKAAPNAPDAAQDPGPDIKPSPRTIALVCKECGGAIQLAEGARIANCPSCATSFVVTTPVGVQRYYVPPFLTTKEAALMAAGAALEGMEIPNRLVGDAQLVFAPLWDLHGEVEGWISWKRPIRQVVIEDVVPSPIHGTETVVVKWVLEEGGERCKRMVAWEGRYIFPGIKVGEFGLYEVKDEQFPLLRPYDEGEMHKYGTVFTPQDPSEGDASEQAQRYYLEYVLSPYGNAEDVHHRLKVTRQRSPLVIFYPVWVVRYLSGRKLYRMTLDAATGNIVYLDRPKKKVRLNPVLWLLGVMLFAFVITTPSKAFSALHSPREITELMALLVIPLFGAGIVLMLWLENFLWDRFAERFAEKVLGEFTGNLF